MDWTQWLQQLLGGGQPAAPGNNIVAPNPGGPWGMPAQMSDQSYSNGQSSAWPYYNPTGNGLDYLNYYQSGPNAGYKIDPTSANQMAADAAEDPYSGNGGDKGNTMSGGISQAFNQAHPGLGGGQPQGSPGGDGMLAFMQAQALAATQYQQEQMDLANRRFAWEQQQAQAAAQQAQQARESNAADSYNKMVLDYMGKNPITGGAVARGFFAPGGQANSTAMAPNADLAAYYQQHPELGPAPGTGSAPIGYTGNAAISSDNQQMQIPQTGPAQQAGRSTPGTVGINLPDFMYGLRQANGTPVPLGPQQEAQMQGSNNQNANAFQDYVGHYAGFDPNQLLSDSVGMVGGGIKGAGNFTDPTMNGVQF